ncbi:MAG: universal stress protein [Methanosarcinaceae archaeon]|nr:universal stress protein [Methanosarcinaceae archaeon]MDD4496840.1 universal stress protein [Methanosarcinaceae archaeon]
MIATDGSDGAGAATGAGIEIARLSGAKVYAVYAIDTGAYLSIPKDINWEETMYGQFEKYGKEAVASVEKAAKAAGLEVEAVLLKGHPAEELIDFAKKERIDLIVLGSHGKSGIERFLLGSVSEKVIRNSKVSVLLVRGREET